MRARGFAFAAALALSSIFFADVCDLVFRCGCRSLWAGAAEACNIHRETGPHCPWCAHPFRAGTSTFALVALAQAAIAFGPGPRGTLLRFGLALLSFPAAVVGTIPGFLWDYWAR